MSSRLYGWTVSILVALMFFGGIFFASLESPPGVVVRDLDTGRSGTLQQSAPDQGADQQLRCYCQMMEQPGAAGTNDQGMQSSMPDRMNRS